MNKFLLFLLLSITSTYALPPPYDNVKLLPYTDKGYFASRQIAGFNHLFDSYEIKTVVEIGSYLGKSTRFIAKHLPQGGKVYAIDHWEGSDEWKSKKKFKKEQPLYYRQFLSNVIHAGLTDKIVPMRMTSLEAEKIIPIEPDLIFIDGSHDYQSVYEDITAWYPHVEGHGILCGDDYGWGGKARPVKHAVDQYAQENNLTVRVIEGWFWYYEPK